MALEQKRLLTYEDYAALPDDGRRYELIDGILYMLAVSHLYADRPSIE